MLMSPSLTRRLAQIRAMLMSPSLTRCLAQIRAMLMSGPDVVVADEAHQMKNPATQQFKAMMQIATKKRIALTGYPLQNNRRSLLSVDFLITTP